MPPGQLEGPEAGWVPLSPDHQVGMTVSEVTAKYKTASSKLEVKEEPVGQANGLPPRHPHLLLSSQIRFLM